MLMNMLTACSPYTVRMVDLCIEMSKIKSGINTGSINIKLNEKGLSKFLQDNQDIMEPFEIPFKDLTIEYEGKFNKNKENFGVSLSLKCNIDGDKLDLGEIFVNDKNVYISTKTLFNILDLAGGMYPDEIGNISENKEMFADMFGDMTHIELLPPESYNFSDIYDSDALIDIFAGFAKDVFWDFNFYSVKLTAENIYTLSMNVNEVQNMLVKMVEYLTVNQQRVFDAAERFVTKMYDAGLNEMLGLGGELDEVLAIINENRSLSSSYSSEYKNSLNELKDTIAGFKDLKDYEKSSFTYSIGTYNNSYLESLNGSFKQGDETLFEFAVKSSVVTEDVKFDDIKALPYESFVGLMVNVEE